MKKQIITTILIFSVVLLFGQSSQAVKDKNIGINYFGELGFRPGLEIDYGLNLWNREREGKKRVKVNQLNLRPSLAYYRYSNYSNNVLLSLKLNYQTKHIKANHKYFFIEPSVRVGYLRYILAGEVFETQDNKIIDVRYRGSNSIVLGSALDIGGYLSKRFDWLCGVDYYAESTEDKLIIHRFVAKLGTRIKLNTK